MSEIRGNNVDLKFLNKRGEWEKNCIATLVFFLKESIVLLIDLLNTPPQMNYILHVCENI